MSVFPYIVAAWLVLGATAAIFVPGLAGRIDRELHERAEVDTGAPPDALPALSL